MQLVLLESWSLNPVFWWWARPHSHLVYLDRKSQCPQVLIALWMCLHSWSSVVLYPGQGWRHLDKLLIGEFSIFLASSVLALLVTSTFLWKVDIPKFSSSDVGEPSLRWHIQRWLSLLIRPRFSASQRYVSSTFWLLMYTHYLVWGTWALKDSFKVYLGVIMPWPFILTLDS